MAENVWTRLVHEVHASDVQLVVAVTGGGSKAISQLLETPGASRTVLEAVVPYSPASLEAWLGSAPDQSCSAQTTRAMAMVAWRRARELAPDANPGAIVGVAATASLASDRPKRGDHRVHVALQTSTSTACDTLVLSKGERDRKKEEWLAAKLLLLAVGGASGIDIDRAAAALDAQLSADEPIESSLHRADVSWTELLLGSREFVTEPANSLGDGKIVILPGAFNPPHAGHRQIAKIAGTRTGVPVAYELSITNVDKPPLDFQEIATRLEALRSMDADATMLLTAAPTFRAKSALFPGCTFAVGADTMQRVADPKYYAGDASGFDAAIAQIAGRGCRFLVFGRELDGRFHTLRNLEIPAELRSICDEISADEFREDGSSTEMRRR